MFRLMPQDTPSTIRPPSRLCDVCGAPTRERKPYCPDCVVDHASYPKALMAIMKGVEDELEAVKVRGAKGVRLDGLVVEEILTGIGSNGSLTWRRLLKDHVAFLNNVEDAVGDAYLRKLRASGLVAVTHTRRGGEVVSLSAKGFAHIRNGRSGVSH